MPTSACAAPPLGGLSWTETSAPHPATPTLRTSKMQCPIRGLCPAQRAEPIPQNRESDLAFPKELITGGHTHKPGEAKIGQMHQPGGRGEAEKMKPQPERKRWRRGCLPAACNCRGPSPQLLALKSLSLSLIGGSSTSKAHPTTTTDVSPSQASPQNKPEKRACVRARVCSATWEDSSIGL